MRTPTEKLFSSVATHALYARVTARSGRHGVTVVVGSDVYTYGRPGHGVGTDEHVLATATDAVAAYSRGRYDPENGWDILRSAPTLRRGEHTFSVWMPERVHDA